MFKNQLLTAWRNLRKNKSSSLINIIGLSTGMTCFIIIFLYISNEFSYDQYYPHADRLYRVVKDFANEGGANIPDATTPPALAPALRKDMPEVKYVTRLFPAWDRKYLIQYKDKGFYETSLIRIDSSFFDVFNFPVLRGTVANTFKDPLSIILTQSVAKKYFGNADPIGERLHINLNNGLDFTVTAVIKDIPLQSHFRFDYLIPFTSRRDSLINEDWNWNGFYTYALLKENANPAAFNQKLQPLYIKYQPRGKSIFFAQAIADIHLHSNLRWELGVNNDIAYIRILGIIAFFVIVIAGINYVNLVTAQSVKRAKEVGVRKVTGASKSSLITQFLTEATCNAFISFVISIFITALLLPLVNKMVDRELVLFSMSQWTFWTKLITIVLFIGLVSGLYPAFYLSSYQPVHVLKGRFIASLRSANLRKGLVVFQFVISIVLIVSFFTIYRQVDFISQKNLGFNKDNILLMPNVRSTGRILNVPQGSWLDEVRKLPAVASVARADGILGGLTSANGVSSQHTHVALNFIRIDHEFLPTMQIKLDEGRNFFNTPRGDSASIIINKKAAEDLGLQKPYAGQQLAWDDGAGRTHPVTIVGVTENFHFTSMHEAIKPFAFISEENNGSTFIIRLHPQNLGKDIAAISQIWTKYNPDKPFDYSFQDEQLARLYQSDVKFKNLFSWVTALAVIIACLGLLGLSIFTAEARNKEVSVRKVLGASTASLFHLLCKDFLLLVVVAFGISVPIAWWAMNNWLQGYAYRIDLSWWIFVGAGVTALLVALATTSYHAVKAAIGNPVKSLRSE